MFAEEPVTNTPVVVDYRPGHPPVDPIDRPTGALAALDENALSEAYVLTQQAKHLMDTTVQFVQRDQANPDVFVNLPEGLAAEQAVRNAGALIDQIAEQSACTLLADVDAFYSAQYGVSSREQYLTMLQTNTNARALDVAPALTRIQETVDRVQALEQAAQQAYATQPSHIAEAARQEYADAYADWEQQAAALEGPLAEGRAWHQQLLQAQDGNDPWGTCRNEIRRLALHSTLTRLRPMGPQGPMAVHQDSDPDAVSDLTAVAAYYPTDWIARSDMDPMPLVVHPTPGRASYAHGKAYDPTPETNWLGYAKKKPPQIEVGYLTVSTEQRGGLPGYQSVALHEFGHRAECENQRIVHIEQVFLSRRTLHPSTGPEAPSAIPGGSGPDERGWQDGFVDHYVGRLYSGAQTTQLTGQSFDGREVFTFGMEMLFSGRGGGGLGEGGHQADREHRALTLGLLVSA